MHLLWTLIGPNYLLHEQNKHRHGFCHSQFKSELANYVWNNDNNNDTANKITTRPRPLSPCACWLTHKLLQSREALFYAEIMWHGWRRRWWNSHSLLLPSLSLKILVIKKKCSSWICNVSTKSTVLTCHPKDLRWYSSDCPCLPLLQPAHSQLTVNKQSKIQWIKGVSFWRICGAASVGEYSRVI